MFDRFFRRRGSARRAPVDLLATVQHIRAQFARNYTVIDRQRDFHAVLRATPAGKRVLSQILDRSRACERSYVPGDSLETARREGMRDIGLWLIDMVTDDRPGRPRSAEAEAPADDDRPGGAE